MTIWQRITDALAALANGEGLSAIFDKLRTEPEHSVGFAIAVIALGAKMAKADGLVTRDEVAAFREVFDIPQADSESAARVFNLARQDVAGFDSYARKIAAMFTDQPAALSDLMEGLFHIALADGDYHRAENAFLREVALIFGMSESDFRCMRARFVPDARRDPYTVLGIPADAALDDIRARWRALVREAHPDLMISRGVPEEAIRLAEKRLIAINEAWDEIVADRAA
ncbi:molecular chaperone DjiA [Litoreibacter roseus]|uniref:Molecular chaperone DjlA n=1 Tax=Litoreibacter roseus TaxID=2601869 RepID=A0A6N6JI88_9RHOB|nr:molecular chaperone DjiA [Litoreibacter roseus]GFE65657.1 molecular chaperone DjlA [Litoreibacter roseus]